MRRGRPGRRASAPRLPGGGPACPGDREAGVGVGPGVTARGAAGAGGGIRGERGRRNVPGRGVLPESEGRIPLRPLRRWAAVLPAERAEAARALMIELFPEGFEERDLAD